MSSRSPNSEASGQAPPGGVAVGRVLRAHGIRGEVKVEVWSDVAERFGVGKELVLHQKPSAASGRAASPGRRRRQSLRIESCRRDRGVLLIRFTGIADRDAAESLHGAVLEIEETQVPDAPDGFFYFFQLVGCEVIDATAGRLGTVTEVVEDGGGHLLAVKRSEGAVLVPFVDAFLGRVDVEQRFIEVDLPEGLLESCTSPS